MPVLSAVLIVVAVNMCNIKEVVYIGKHAPRSDFLVPVSYTHLVAEMDQELICHTINGRPVKPKTLGQQNYVDQIRKKMIGFGIGPAGTGKTYLAMAMGITAFKNDEVGRIILTRPAIEAGEKLGFLPGDLQRCV